MSSRKSKSEGVDATNRDYIRYEQVDKRQSYSLSESARTDEFDETFEIRTCDLERYLRGNAADRAQFASELGEALREIGFAVLVGHGVDPALHDECAAEVERLFTETPLARKNDFRARRHGSINQGYFPIEETTDIHPDLVEGWVFCRRAFPSLRADATVETGDFWPKVEFERCFRRLWEAHEPLVLPLMQSMLTYLGCDPHLYDRRLTGTNFGLRLNYYPPIDAPSRSGRLLGHEDVDLFTMLPAPRGEGLQVLTRANFKWIRLDAPPGSIILNTGDYMQRISNDILPSTTHRVAQPRDLVERKRARVSFPMNVYVWEDEMLEVLPGLTPAHYESVRAIEFHTNTTAKYYGDDYRVSR